MKHLLPFLETRATKLAKEQDIEAKQLVFKRAWDRADEADRKHLDELFDASNEEWVFLRKNKEWMFNFTSGGWNTMMAGDKETAIERAIDEYKGSSSLVVDKDTFCMVEFNEASYNSALRNFN